MPNIISIEGNIGAGKTTIINQIAELNLPGVLVLREPVDEWLNVKDSDKNILEHYYSDPKKYAFTFQMVAFHTRLINIKKALDSGYNTIICERSLQSDEHIFAKMLYEEGTMDEISYRAYQTICGDVIRNFPLQKVVYLDVPPNVCKERIIRRCRSGEESISIEYLELCEKYHREWLDSDLEYPVVKYTTFEDLLWIMDE